MTEGKPRVLTLDELNAFGTDEAVDFFLSCCRSTKWAKSMSECRPFWNLQIVGNAADTIWQYLTPEDWREALRGRRTAPAIPLTAELREGLERYEAKFGYMFLLDPESPTAKDALPVLQKRLENPLQHEIKVAAAQEGIIMRKEIRTRIRG